MARPDGAQGEGNAGRRKSEERGSFPFPGPAIPAFSAGVGRLASPEAFAPPEPPLASCYLLLQKLIDYCVQCLEKGYRALSFYFAKTEGGAGSGPITQLIQECLRFRTFCEQGKLFLTQVNEEFGLDDSSSDSDSGSRLQFPRPLGNKPSVPPPADWVMPRVRRLACVGDELVSNTLVHILTLENEVEEIYTQLKQQRVKGNLTLDRQRNALLEVSLHLEYWCLGVAFIALITGLLGMNLTNFANYPDPPPPPYPDWSSTSHPWSVFLLVLGVSVICFLILVLGFHGCERRLHADSLKHEADDVVPM